MQITLQVRLYEKRCSLEAAPCAYALFRTIPSALKVDSDAPTGFDERL